MFKIVYAEIKKMVSKPGIYILAVLLALILALGVFIYKPTVYEKTTYTLMGSDFMSKYNNYAIDGRKKEADALITVATNTINNYYIDGNTYKAEINDKIEKFNRTFIDYRECAINGASSSTINTIKSNLISSLESLYSTIKIGIENNKVGTYSILTTNSNYINFTTNYTKILTLFNSSGDIENICNEYISKYHKAFKNTLANFYYPTLNEEIVSNYSSTTNSRLATVLERLTNINNAVEALNTEVYNNPDKNTDLSIKAEMDRLSNLYTNTAKTYSRLVKYELLNNAFSTINTNTKLDLMNLSNEDSYNTSNSLIKYDYLFEHNKTDIDYANPLTIGVTSNPNINAYDYAYFILKLFSFIIIVYAVMCGCHTIAGEIKEGSMRYLAIRPVSRTRIFFGKMIAIIMMSIILILFSSVIALLVGGFVYGFNSLNILTIFNGIKPITLHPLAMIAIYLVSLLLELIVYLSLAMLLSTLIKSDLFAVTLILVIYLLNIILPLFIVGPNTWLSFYPFSHITLYSLFGSSLYLLSDNPYSSLLGTKVYATTNVWITLSVITIIVLISNLISSRIFKNKEL